MATRSSLSVRTPSKWDVVANRIFVVVGILGGILGIALGISQLVPHKIFWYPDRVAVTAGAQQYALQQSKNEAPTRQNKAACKITLNIPTIVTERDSASGTMTPANMDVVLVVHSLEDFGRYFVQQRVSVDQAGKFETVNAFGERDLHRGVRYEVLAVGGPINALSLGQVLSTWPKGACQSDLVHTTRR